jgi:hypothetical protein
MSDETSGGSDQGLREEGCTKRGLAAVAAQGTGENELAEALEAWEVGRRTLDTDDDAGNPTGGGTGGPKPALAQENPLAEPMEEWATRMIGFDGDNPSGGTGGGPKGGAAVAAEASSEPVAEGIRPPQGDGRA